MLVFIISSMLKDRGTYVMEFRTLSKRKDNVNDEIMM